MEEHTQEWLARQIVEGAQDAIIFSDREGLIRLWNTGAEAIFGYSAKEVTGRSLDLIIPEKLRTRHWDGYKKVMETGVTRYGRELLAVPAQRKEGSRISTEFTIVLVRSPAGEVLGAAAILRDVTARWEKEKALKEKLASLQKQEH